jgi:hypothetical protein
LAFTDAASNATDCAGTCANSRGADQKPAVTPVQMIRTAADDLVNTDGIVETA